MVVRYTAKHLIAENNNIYRFHFHLHISIKFVYRILRHLLIYYNDFVFMPIYDFPIYKFTLCGHRLHKILDLQSLHGNRNF